MRKASTFVALLAIGGLSTALALAAAAEIGKPSH
jgi:hypothetical protein